MAKMICLEGTTLEGGGQLLRIALGVSSLTKTPIGITNIRGKRSGGGGLKWQHLTSVEWLAGATNAELHGAEIKSKNLRFVPSTKVEPGNRFYPASRLLENSFYRQEDGRGIVQIEVSQKTPGSVGLVFQAILPYLLFSGYQLSPQEDNHPLPIKVRIHGGSNVSNSPSFEYVQQVLVPMLELVGLPKIKAELITRGWSTGPIKMGIVEFTVPALPIHYTLPAFKLSNRGDIAHVQASILAPKAAESHFRNALANAFTKKHSNLFGPGSEAASTEITFEDSAHEKRFYLLIVATSTTGIKLGRDWLYNQPTKKGDFSKISAEMVKAVTDELISEIEHGGCVDEYMRDQLVVFQALASGRSEVYGGKRRDGTFVQPSLHTQTAHWVTNRVLGMEFDDEGSCEGISFEVGEAFQNRQRPQRTTSEVELAVQMETMTLGT